MAKEKYNKYKNSTVSWLGDIPEHWEIRRIKYVFQELDSRSETGKEDLLSVSQYTGVTKKSDKVAEGENISNAKTLEGYKIVEKGNLVINIMLAWNGSLGISKYNGIVSPAYCVYKNLIGDERYFGYLFKTKNAKQEFKKQSTGIIDSRLRMYTDSFFNIKTALPPKQEQTTIANFLDYKTEKINRFVTKKKQLIELLNEQKAAIINQAVTKGLDPNVPMKDSGIEWLDKIPEHWEVRRLKYVANNLNRRRVPIESSIRGKMKNGIYDYYGATGVIDKVEDFIFNETTLLVAEDGANLVMRNLKLVYKATGKYWVNNHAHIIKTKKGYDMDYFANYLESYDYNPHISGSAQPKLTKENFMNVKVLCPPELEQKKIASFIEIETKKINKTITTIQKEITLVAEYKTALIAEAVTGKIDVRDFKLPTQSTPLAMVAEEASNYNK